MHNKKRFADQFMLTCLAYEKDFNTALANLYFSDLSDYSDDQVCTAMERHRKDAERGRFFPKVADIIYQINGTAKTRADADESQAELEWSKIYAAACNGNEPANISVEARSALRSIGGAHKVGYTLEKDIPFLKREFMALRKSLVNCSSDQIDDSIPLHSELINKKTQVAIK